MSELSPDTRLGAIRLRGRDVGLLRDFYERAIGLRAVSSNDGVPHSAREATRSSSSSPAPDAPGRPPGTTGLFHLAVLIPTRADLARALRRVFDAGWHLSGASDHLVSEALYLSDPEGNGIELYRDRPREEWPHQGDEIAMATLPLDLEGLLAEPGADVDAPSMPDGTVLGHVHLQVADLDTASAFWVGAVGFDVMTSLYPGALFVSAGGYHHHLGLNTWAGVGAPPPPAGAQGLDRFEIVLPDEASVSAARERLGSVAEVRDSEAGLVSADSSGNSVLIRAA